MWRRGVTEDNPQGAAFTDVTALNSNHKMTHNRSTSNLGILADHVDGDKVTAAFALTEHLFFRPQDLVRCPYKV